MSKELTDAEVLKWREHIIDLFLQMLDKKEIEPLIDGAWDTDEMGSGCFSYYSLDNADFANEDIFLHINDTVNFPDLFDDDSIKDVYMTLASIDGSVDVPKEYWHVRFNVPTSDENIKATIKKVYEFFRNSKDPEEFYNFDKLPDLDESADDLKALDGVLGKPVMLVFAPDYILIRTRENKELDSFSYDEALNHPIVQHGFKVDTLYVNCNTVIPDLSIFDHLTIEQESYLQFPVDFNIEELLDKIGEEQISKKWEVEVVCNNGHASVEELQKVIDVLGKYGLSFSAPLFDVIGDEELVIDTPYGHDFLIDMCVPEKPESSGSLTLKGNGEVWICNDGMDIVDLHVVPNSELKIISDTHDVTLDYTNYDELPDDFNESLNEDISWNGLADSIRSGLKHGERNGTDGTIKWVLTTSLDDCWDNMTEDMKEFLLDEIDTNISTDLKVFKRTERDNKLTDTFTFTFEGSVDEVSAKYGIAKEHIEPSNKEGIVRLPFSFELTVDEYGALPDLDEDFKMTDRSEFAEYAFYHLMPHIGHDLSRDKHEGDCKGCMWKVVTTFDDFWNELSDITRSAINQTISSGICAIFDVYYDDVDRLFKEIDGKKCHERRVWISNSHLYKDEQDVREVYGLPDSVQIHYEVKHRVVKCYYFYIDYKFELIPYDVENMPLPDAFDESAEEPRIGRVLLGKDNRKLVQDAMTQAPLNLKLDGLEVIALVVKAENVDDDIIANINKLDNVERTCIFELCDLRGFDFSLLDRFDFKYLTLKYCIVDENLAKFINDRTCIICLENCTILKGTVFENARDIVIKNCLGDLEIGSGAENLQFIDEGGLNLVLNLNSGLEFIDYNYDDYDLTEFYAEHPEYFKELPDDFDESFTVYHGGKTNDTSHGLKYYALDKNYVKLIHPRAKINQYEIEPQNIFDYSNPKHVEMLLDKLPEEIVIKDNYRGYERTYTKEHFKRILEGDEYSFGNWNLLEDKEIQKIIKDLGFDSMYLLEYSFSGKEYKNIAVFESSDESLLQRLQRLTEEKHIAYDTVAISDRFCSYDEGKSPHMCQPEDLNGVYAKYINASGRYELLDGITLENNGIITLGELATSISFEEIKYAVDHIKKSNVLGLWIRQINASELQKFIDEYVNKNFATQIDIHTLIADVETDLYIDTNVDVFIDEVKNTASYIPDKTVRKLTWHVKTRDEFRLGFNGKFNGIEYTKIAPDCEGDIRIMGYDKEDYIDYDLLPDDFNESVDNFYHDLYSRIITRIKRGEREGIVDSTKWKLKTSIDKYWDSISDEITVKALKVIANNINNRVIGELDGVINGGITIPFSAYLSSEEVSKKFNIPVNLLTDFMGLSLPINYALVLEEYGALPDLDESLNLNESMNRTLVVEDGVFKYRDYFDNNYVTSKWDEFMTDDIAILGNMRLDTLMVRSKTLPDLSFIKDKEIGWLYLYPEADVKEVADKLADFKIGKLHTNGIISQDMQLLLNRQYDEVTLECATFDGDVELDFNVKDIVDVHVNRDNTGSLVVNGSSRVFIIDSVRSPIKFNPSFKGKIEYVFGDNGEDSYKDVTELIGSHPELVLLKDGFDESLLGNSELSTQDIATIAHEVEDGKTEGFIIDTGLQWRLETSLDKYGIEIPKQILETISYAIADCGLYGKNPCEYQTRRIGVGNYNSNDSDEKIKSDITDLLGVYPDEIGREEAHGFVMMWLGLKFRLVIVGYDDLPDGFND